MLGELVSTALVHKKGHLATTTLPGAMLFTGTEPFIRIIAFILLVYRVTTGRAWKRETEWQITSLQWNRSHHASVPSNV